MTDTRKINKETFDLMVSFEGIEKKGKDGLIYPYYDCIGLPTIGIGHLLSYVKNEDLSKYKPLSLQEVYELFEKDVNVFADSITRLVPVVLNDNEFGAITSLCFNIGLGNFTLSSLRKKLLNGVNRKECADEFLKWDRAGSRQVAGLTRRRKAERELFLKV